MKRCQTFHCQSFGSKPVESRLAILLAVVALHFGIIVMLFLTKPSVRPQQKRGALSVFALAASIVPSAKKIPEPVIPVNEIAMIPSPAEAHAEQQSADGNPDGKVCSPLDEVTSQLASDPIVPLAINRVARSDRSISEAIVMWNAEWSVAAATDESPLAEVRNRIIQILESLPPECLASPVIGPRLIAIPEKGYTTLLAFGSGEWSWQQLIALPDDLSSSQKNTWAWRDLFAQDYSITPF